MRRDTISDDTWQRIAEDHSGIGEMGRALGPPVTEAEIAELSTALGLLVFGQFRDFLLRAGGAAVGSYEIYGLRPTAGSSELVQEMNQRWRVRGISELEEQWLLISDDGSGNPIGLDAGGRVLRADHDGGMVVDELGVDFEDFLRRECLRLDA